MSHFTVAVITKGKPAIEEIELALAPYQENNMGDCPREYMKFHSYSEEYKDEYENGTTERAKMPSGRLVYTWSSELNREISKEEYEKLKAENVKGLGMTRGFNEPERYYIRDLEYVGAEIVTIPYKKLYKTFNEYLEEEQNAKFDEEMQDYGYWENPNAKWDWYQIGGRYAGRIRTNANNEDVGYGEKSLFYGSKNPYESENENIKCVDSARVKDIIVNDPNEYKRKLRFWELYVEGQEPQNEEEKDMIKWVFYKKEYFINKYGTKERYAELESTFTTWAVITKDGQWHEAGTMGWFACSSATIDEEVAFQENYKKFVFDNAEEDDYMTLVDCHI